MPNNYYSLGMAKRLHEIVMVGTHDAGITTGHSNVQTQNYDINEQAKCGVRFFDLRIAAAKSTPGPGGVKGVEMKAYHGSLSTKTKTRAVTIGGVTQMRQLERSTMKIEGWGLSLTSIFHGADAFVTSYPTEFLLLKFDKCKNWNLIAEAAVAELGNHLYNDGGDLNTKTLHDLQGKVIVLFSREGIQEITPAAILARHTANLAGGAAAAPNLDSILPWQNLQKEKAPAYSPNPAVSPGLKYFGSFGDSMLMPTTDKKIQKNLSKQTANMSAARLQDYRVLRMMYWTTTGIIQNIQDRNREMWQPQNLREFLTAWDSGVSNIFVNHAPHGPGAVVGMAAANQIRNYFPNIIMVDFADQTKCDLVYNLNMLSTGQIDRGMTLVAKRAGM